MMHQSRQYGVASIMALIFMALCATLSVFLYAMLSSSTAITRNNDYQKRATLAAESGLDYLTLMLPEVSRSQIVTGTSTEEVIDSFRAVLSSRLSGNPAITGSNGQLEIGPVNLDANSSFSATITALGAINKSDPSPEFKVTVTGSYAANGMAVTRVIGVDAEALTVISGLGGAYGIIARGDIILPDADNVNGGVFYNEVGSGLNTSREGTATEVVGGSVMMFDNAEPPGSITLPTYSPSLYTKLDAYNWSTFDKSASTWKNVRIPAPANGQPYVITQNLTIEGVLYLEYGTSISFGNDATKNQTLTIKGAIIWEPRGSRPEKTQTLTLGRYIGINTPVEGRDDALGTVLGSNAFAELLNGNLVVAPQTNLRMDAGNEVTGIKYFNGGMHVNNVTGSGTGNVLSKTPTTGSTVFTNGGIIAEGNVTFTGNTAFCVQPPGSASPDDANRYGIQTDPATYWEQ